MSPMVELTKGSRPAVRRRFSLQARVLVSISAVVSVVFVTAVATAMYVIHQDRKADLMARAESLAELQSAGLARPIWDFELEQATAMLQTLNQDPDFRFARIDDPDGNAIGSIGLPVVGDGRSVYTVRREIRYAAASVAGTDQDEKKLGTLTLVLSETRLLDSLKTMVGAGLLLLAVILFVVIALVGGALRMMTKPLGGIARAMAELAGGNLATAVPSLDRTDEVGDMAQAVQVFKDNALQKDRLEKDQAAAKQRADEERRTSVMHLSERFEQTIREVAEGVSSSAAELQTTAEQMTSTAEETSRQSATVATASEEAAGNVQTVATTAEELSASISEIGRQVTVSARIASSAVAEAAAANATVQSLAVAASKIGEVVDLINNIAGQTNLLALNATIEAARAGEAGKGFAVVAQEVKTLASQTAKATGDIADQIAAVQGETNGAVSAIQKISGIIAEISDISTTIASAIEEQGASTEEIARNVQQAAQRTEQVNVNIGGVSRAVGETGTAADRVLTASQDMSQQAEGLYAAVDRFLQEIRTA